MWRSDGTASRTIQLEDINPGIPSAEIGSIRRMGNAIYFNAKSETTDTALWRSSDILETNKPHQLGNNWKEGIYIMRIFVDGKVTHKRVAKGRQVIHE